MKKIYLILTLFITVAASAQVVETPDIDSTGQQQETSSFLRQAGAGINPDPLMPPRLNLKTYKLSAEIARTWWDFYVLNTVPTFNVNEDDSIKSFSNEVLNQTGGVLNVALSKVAYFANGKDDLNKDVRGAQLDFRAGTKLLDPPTRKYSEFIVPTFQTSLDLRYLIPLSASKVRNKEELKKKMIGNLSFRVYGTWQKIFASKTYNRYFISRKGNEPPTNITTYGYEINLFITNELFLSFGQTFSNLLVMPTRTMISISYSNLSN